jgi:hypothetical protein
MNINKVARPNQERQKEEDDPGGGRRYAGMDRYTQLETPLQNSTH